MRIDMVQAMLQDFPWEIYMAAYLVRYPQTPYRNRALGQMSGGTPKARFNKRKPDRPITESGPIEHQLQAYPLQPNMLALQRTGSFSIPLNMYRVANLTG